MKRLDRTSQTLRHILPQFYLFLLFAAVILDKKRAVDRIQFAQATLQTCEHRFAIVFQLGCFETMEKIIRVAYKFASPRATPVLEKNICGEAINITRYPDIF